MKSGRVDCSQVVASQIPVISQATRSNTLLYSSYICGAPHSWHIMCITSVIYLQVFQLGKMLEGSRSQTLYIRVTKVPIKMQILRSNSENNYSLIVLIVIDSGERVGLMML